MAENIKPALDDPKAAPPVLAPKPKAKSPDPIQRVKASGKIFAEATQLESAGSWTIVDIEAKDQVQAEPEKKVKFQDVQQGVILPVGAAIGDLVELYFTGYTGRVFTPEGDSLAYTNERTSVDVGSSAMFRKISDKGWRYVAGA